MKKNEDALEKKIETIHAAYNREPILNSETEALLGVMDDVFEAGWKAVMRESARITEQRRLAISPVGSTLKKLRELEDRVDWATSWFTHTGTDDSQKCAS